MESEPMNGPHDEAVSRMLEAIKRQADKRNQLIDAYRRCLLFIDNVNKANNVVTNTGWHPLDEVITIVAGSKVDKGWTAVKLDGLIAAQDVVKVVMSLVREKLVEVENNLAKLLDNAHSAVIAADTDHM